MRSAFIKPSFDALVEMLMLEQSKLIDMGILTSLKTKELVASNENQSNQGRKSYTDSKKKQWKQKSQSETQQSSSSQQGNSSSNKKGNNNKKDKLFCAYCKKPNHDQHHCETKRIDELENLLRKNKFNVPNASKDSTPPTSKGKGQALMASSSYSWEWILDSGASYHMGSSKGHFYSLKQSKVPHIFVGDDTKMEVEGKEHVEMENGELKDVLYVPNLSFKLL